MAIYLETLSILFSYFLTCTGRSVNAFFIFGDSLVDSGNNNYIASLAKANIFPNGIDFLPSQQATGRFTNGRTIFDILGQELGLPNFVPPYLDPTTTGSVVLNGVNYASGGGGILNASGEVMVGRINLDAQIDNYANTRNDIISNFGLSLASTLLKTSIFFVIIGSNDFLNNYFVPFLSVPQRITTPPEVFIEEVIAKYRVQLTRLYNLDARKIVVAGVGPIGCIPYMREINRLSGKNCAEFPNQVAQIFNAKLEVLLEELRSNLEGSIIVYANAYPIVFDIIKNYKSYGFDVMDSACCYVSGQYGGLIPCGPHSKVCEDRSKYVFWDPYHPSDAANVIIAERLLDGDPNDVFPMNVRRLVQA